MKVLIITNLFPNNKQPGRGIFNKQQFCALAKLCDLKVVAPLPWTPKGIGGNRRSIFFDVIDEETINDIPVYHPRYFVTPKIGRVFYGFWFYFGITKKVREIYKNFKFDLVLATWAYPDAFGAALLAGLLKKPLIIKVHGSDINITTYFLRKKMIAWALGQAQKVVAVSEPLKQKIIEMGIAKEKIVVIPNGVNTQHFKPMDQRQCREHLHLSLDKKYVIFIGNLTPVKGVKYLIEAFQYLPKDIILNLIGDGELQAQLEQRVKELNFSDRINFIGRVSHDAVPYWMNAADIFCLPSLNEGCPNVVLEALACKTPVVATKVGAIPELLPTEDYGILTEPENSKMLAHSIQKALDKKWDLLSDKITISDWKTTAEKLFEILHYAKK